MEEIKRYEISLNWVDWEDAELQIENENNVELFEDNDIWCKSKDVNNLIKNYEEKQKAVDNENEQLKADLLEMAKGIIESFTFYDAGGYECCEHCVDYRNKGKHKEDCMVLKAERIIKESEDE